MRYPSLGVIASKHAVLAVCLSSWDADLSSVLPSTSMPKCSTCRWGLSWSNSCPYVIVKLSKSNAVAKGLLPQVVSGVSWKLDGWDGSEVRLMPTRQVHFQVP